MKAKNDARFSSVDYPIFIISVIVATCFYLPMVVFQESSGELIPKVMSLVSGNLDWCFETVCFLCVIFSLWLALGRFGSIKLGKETDEPEFSTFTWIAMFFCAGIGAGAMYWAFLEPLYYLETPPFGIEAFSASAREWALAYTSFHWGITPWAIFTIPAVAFAYVFYVRGCRTLRASIACGGILGHHAEGLIGKIIDILVIVGLLGGLATSLGFVFPMLSGLIANYLSIENSLTLQIVIGLLFTVIFGCSCYKGLYSGIAKLSNMNMIMFLGMILIIFLAGPSAWILSYFFDSLGIMGQNFIRMSFYTDSIVKSGFPETWTVFYWAWWLSWAIYIGLFMARISKGRSLRSFILNMIFVAGGGTLIIFAIIGGYGQHVYYDLNIDLISILNDSGGVAVIYEILDTLPLSKVFIPFFVLVCLIAQATGIDSAAYTLSNISCLDLDHGKEPPVWIRLFWSAAIFLATIALLIVGGMEAVKLSSILTSVPLLALQIIFMLSLMRYLKQDFGTKELLILNKTKK